MAERPTLCIVNWNGLHHLRRSLPAAWRLRASFAEILLVDNGSTDGSVAWVEAAFPGVRILRLAENRGAGAARNAGIAHARSDRILFIDNDVELLEGCAEALMAALDADPWAVAAQATVLYADRPGIVQYDGAAAHYLGMMILENADVPLEESGLYNRQTNSLVTCCFALDRRRLFNIRFDDIYFYINEDHDFGLQIRMAGGRIYAVPGARVLHGHGTAGVSIRQIGDYSTTRVYHTIRNRWIVLLKFHAWPTLAVCAPAFGLFELAQFAMVLRKGWTAEWRRALAAVWRERRAILERRRRIQATRRLGDAELLDGGPLPLRPELARSTLERRLIRLLDGFFEAYWKVARHLVRRMEVRA